MRCYECGSKMFFDRDGAGMLVCECGITYNDMITFARAKTKDILEFEKLDEEDWCGHRRVDLMMEHDSQLIETRKE